MRSARVVGAIGVASFALIAIAGLIEPLWDFPPTTAPSEEFADYVAANRSGFLGTVFAYCLGMGGFLVFAVGLCEWLRQRPGVDRVAVAVLSAGAVSLVTLCLAGFVPMLVLAYRSPGVETARELFDLCFGLLAVSGVPTAIALAAYAIIVFRSRVLPVWTAWIAALGAVAHVLVAASFFFRDGFFSLEGGVIVAVPATMFAWLLAASVVLVLAHEP